MKQLLVYKIQKELLNHHERAQWLHNIPIVEQMYFWDKENLLKKKNCCIMK